MKHVILNRNKWYKKVWRGFKSAWPIIFLFLALGFVGTMDLEDELCKNPTSQQCIDFKK